MRWIFLNVVSCHLQRLLHISSLAPFYHTSDDIHDELLNLQGRCPGLTVDTEVRANVSIDVVNLRRPGASPKHKSFMLFGEHSRELVSPESALHFIKTLCGETSVKPEDQLEHTEFQIVVNGNPNSRRKVEEGQYCLRVNSNGVDLNRNWDEQWEPAPVLDAADTNPGPRAFSEEETQIFRDRVNAFNATSFLTVHSGTKGMYMPWAYDMEHVAERNEPAMMEILRDLDKEYCQCPFGAAGREVGYSCPGTCLDYVYDELRVPFAFAFEIYTNPEDWDDLRDRFEDKLKSRSFLQTYHLAHKLSDFRFSSLFRDHPSDFVQLQRVQQHYRDEMHCFGQFNPTSEKLYTATMENWSRAYLDLTEKVHQRA